MPALVAHYTWLGFVVLHMPFLRQVAFLLTAQMLCGLFQAWIVGLGHNGMASYDANTRPDFWKLQVRLCHRPLNHGNQGSERAHRYPRLDGRMRQQATIR